jgi:hypothetical protein
MSNDVINGIFEIVMGCFLWRSTAFGVVEVWYDR